MPDTEIITIRMLYDKVLGIEKKMDLGFRRLEKKIDREDDSEDYDGLKEYEQI